MAPWSNIEQYGCLISGSADTLEKGAQSAAMDGVPVGHPKPTIHPIVYRPIVYRVGAIAALAFVLSFFIHDAGMALSPSGSDAAAAAGPNTGVPRDDSAEPAGHGEPARDCHGEDHKAEAIGRDRPDCPDVMADANPKPAPVCESAMLEPLPAPPRSPVQQRILFQVFLN